MAPNYGYLPGARTRSSLAADVSSFLPTSRPFQYRIVLFSLCCCCYWKESYSLVCILYIHYLSTIACWRRILTLFAPREKGDCLESVKENRVTTTNPKVDSDMLLPWTDSIVEEASIAKKVAVIVEAVTDDDDDGDVASSSPSFPLFVKTLDGKTLTLDVLPYDTVLCVMTMIEVKTRIPLDLQRLTCAGRPMKKRCALSDFNVQSGSTIDLSIRLCGGGNPPTDPLLSDQEATATGRQSPPFGSDLAGRVNEAPTANSFDEFGEEFGEECGDEFGLYMDNLGDTSVRTRPTLGDLCGDLIKEPLLCNEDEYVKNLTTKLHINDALERAQGNTEQTENLRQLVDLLKNWLTKKKANGWEWVPRTLVGDDAGIYVADLDGHGTIKFGMAFRVKTRVNAQRPKASARMMNQEEMIDFVSEEVVGAIIKLGLPGLVFHEDHRDHLELLIRMQLCESYFACFYKCATNTVGERLVQLPSTCVLKAIATDHDFDERAIKFMKLIPNNGVFCLFTWAPLPSKLQELKLDSDFLQSKLKPLPPKGGFVMLNRMLNLLGPLKAAIRRAAEIGGTDKLIQHVIDKLYKQK